MAIDESARDSVVIESRGSHEPPPDQGNDLTVADLFRRIYQFFYSKTVGLIIILTMAVFVLLGVVIPQASAEVFADPDTKAMFVAQQAERMRGFAYVADFLGLFRVFSSPAFLIVTALLALSILACTTHRIPQLWQRYRHPRTHVSERFFGQARYRGSFETEASTERTMAALRTRLKAKHFRILIDEKDPERSLYVDRFGWGGFGTVVAHASFIIILAAFVLSGTGGIDEQLSIPVGGDAVAVGHGTGLEVEATSLSVPTYEDGTPSDYVSHLIVRRGGQLLGEQDVRVNNPLRVDKVKLHQMTYGFAADVAVRGADGATLFEGSVPLTGRTADEANAVGTIALPEAGFDLRVYVPASGASGSEVQAGEARFQLFAAGEGEVLASEAATPGNEVAVGDLKATFQRERQYTGIGVRQDPGAVWMWIGSALLVLGMSVTFACRHRRVWIRVEEGEEGTARRLRFASNDKEDLAFERLFESLVYDMFQVLNEDQSPKTQAKGGAS